jgi:hypothetical protein
MPGPATIPPLSYFPSETLAQRTCGVHPKGEETSEKTLSRQDKIYEESLWEQIGPQ